MSAVATIARTHVSALVIGLLAAACSKENAPDACSNEKMCPDGVCMMGTCLPLGGNRSVGIEIVPRSDSSSARTSLADIKLTGDPLDLVADRQASIVGMIANAPDAHVEMTLPSPIKGQTDLKVQAELVDDEFRVAVAQSLLNQTATMWLVPSKKPTADPPARLRATLYNTFSLPFPSPAEMTPIRVKLLDTFGTPPGGYTARVSSLTRVISNVATSDDSGEFQLLVAPAALDTPDGTVTIEFTPIDPGVEQQITVPRFQTRPFLLSGPGTSPTGGDMTKGEPLTAYHLPATPTLVTLRFRVQGRPHSTGNTGPEAVAAPRDLPDVALRFRTEFLEYAKTEGTGFFEPEVKTNALGEAEVMLIPGTAALPRPYQIAVVPRPDSPYAAFCVAEHPVTLSASGDGQAPYSATFALDLKSTLTGTIKGSDGKPAANVTVKATVIRGSTRCDVTSTTSVSSPTDRDGAFTLVVDPGMYRLDVDPPPGAPWPRWTEDAVTVDPGSTIHDMTLPAGEVVVGHIRGVDDKDLDGATISMFEELCMGDSCTGSSRVPPALRSLTSTDATGNFKAVLPVPR